MIINPFEQNVVEKIRALKQEIKVIKGANETFTTRIAENLDHIHNINNALETLTRVGNVDHAIRALKDKREDFRKMCVSCEKSLEDNNKVLTVKESQMTFLQEHICPHVETLNSGDPSDPFKMCLLCGKVLS